MSPANDPVGFTEAAELDLLAFFHVPFETGVNAEYPQAQSPPVAGSQACGHERARNRTGVSGCHEYRVFKRLRCAADVEIGPDVAQGQVRDETGQMCGMGADVTRAAGRSRARRIKPPFDVRSLRESFGNHPILHEFNMNLLNPAKSAGEDDFAGLPDHWIAGHDIAYAEYAARRLREFDQVFRFRNRNGEWFLAEDVDS